MCSLQVRCVIVGGRGECRTCNHTRRNTHPFTPLTPLLPLLPLTQIGPAESIHEPEISSRCASVRARKIRPPESSEQIPAHALARRVWRRRRWRGQQWTNGTSAAAIDAHGHAHTAAPHCECAHVLNPRWSSWVRAGASGGG